MSQASLPVTHTKRGRPFDHTHEAELRRLEVWLAVEAVRERSRSGTKISVLQACKQIAAARGVNFFVGGDIDLILASKKIRGTRRTCIQIKKQNLYFADDPKGLIFAASIIREASTLRARYNEALKLLANDEELKAFYQSILDTRLGPRGLRT